MMWLKFAWREIVQSRRFSLFFIFNLALGLFGFLCLDAFKTSFERSLSAQSKAMLTADVAVSARRALTPAESLKIKQSVGPGAEQSQATVLYSMVSTDNSGSMSRLVELVAIDEHYPLYGEILLRSGRRIHGSDSKEINQLPEVWVSPEFQAQMNVRQGEPLKIGALTFRIADFIQADTSSSWQGMSLAPRVYLGKEALKKTELVQQGSTVTYRWFFKLPHDDSEVVLSRLDAALEDPSLQVVNHRTSSAQTGRFMDYLNDYLGLVSLVALFLAAVGAGYLFRSFLAMRLKEIAVYMSLGVTQANARKIYLLQLAILGGFAAIIASLASAAVLPQLTAFLNRHFHLPIQYFWTPRSLILALVLGITGSVLICWPLLEKIRHLSANALFQESMETEGTEEFRLKSLFAWFPALSIFWGLAVWQANSWKVGSLFVGGFLIAGIIQALLGNVGLAAIGRRASGLGLRLRMALRSLSRHRVSSLSCFLAIGLGSLLINLIPQIQKNLETEIVRPEVSEVPSLFFFDIQEEQVAPLTRFISESGSRLTGISPLIRARLERINGLPFEKRTDPTQANTREEERDERSRNRGFNLTYRLNLTEAETIVKGRPFTGRYESKSSEGTTGQEIEVPAELSVEKDFADRLKIRLGDLLTFDVQGVPISGKVVNFRKVKWTSFQPNFFIQFQPGALDDAPKTFLASVPRLNLNQRAQLQNRLVKQFPNISIVDITQVIQKLLNLFVQMGWAIELMAWLSLFSGFVVVFSIANHQAQSRRTETHLLKILGAKFGDIRGIYLLEFSVLAASASLLGATLSLALSFLLSRFLFDGLWIFSWKVPLSSVFAITAISAFTTWVATRAVLHSKPIEILQSDLH